VISDVPARTQDKTQNHNLNLIIGLPSHGLVVRLAGLASNNSKVIECWQGGVGNTTGGSFLDNHNWVEFWDDVAEQWVTSNDPGTSVNHLCAGIGGAELSHADRRLPRTDFLTAHTC
jgi:hypothetical protein